MRVKIHLKRVTPGGEKRAVAPVRRPNAEFRAREHLTPGEVGKLIDAAKSNRHGLRDSTMILVAYRHALRASEICDLEWAAIDFEAGVVHVRRSKNGKPSTHPIRGDELRELRKLKRTTPESAFVFVSERGGPFTTDSFNWLVKRAGKKAKLPFQCHAHMLRHSAGYKLAGDGHDTRSIQDYLGHRDIRHTVKYTELSEIHRAVAEAVPRLLEIESRAAVHHGPVEENVQFGWEGAGAASQGAIGGVRNRGIWWKFFNDFSRAPACAWAQGGVASRSAARTKR